MKKKSVLLDKEILAIIADPELLKSTESELAVACPTCRLEKVATYQEAVDKLVSWTYDLVVLDPMIAQGEMLLEIAHFRKLPIIFLTDPGSNLKRNLGRSASGSQICLSIIDLKKSAFFSKIFLDLTPLSRMKIFCSSIIRYFQSALPTRKS